MMERVYVLAKIDSNSLEKVLASLNKMGGVTAADPVTGAYDMLICLEGDSVARILSSVVRDIRQIPGIISTETLVVIGLD